MIAIDGIEVLQMQIKFSHNDFNIHQFGFGYLTLKKGTRTFKLDTKANSAEWVEKGLSILTFFLPETDNLDKDDLQDLTKEDILSGLDEAFIWIDDGHAEWEVDVEIISAHLLLKNKESIISIPLTF